jgi:ADP-heptose:LPS heptosyltransferase/tetratricopeptide (TPR) repeat protein
MIGRILQLGARRKKLSAARAAADQARDTGEFAKAALLYEQALQMQPSNAAIHIQCGHMFKETGDLGRAEHHYNCAKQLKPDDPDLWLQLGHLYKIAGRLAEAEVSYRKAVALLPGWREPAGHLAQLRRMGLATRANGGGGDPLDGANGSAAQLLVAERSSARPEPSHRAAGGGGRAFRSAAPRSENLRLAEIARRARRYRQAAVLYEEVLRGAPDDAAIHVQAGHMFKEAGELARAEQHYETARKLIPDDPDLALQFGHFYKVAGRPREAELSFQRSIDLAPEWPEPARQLAELYRSGWRKQEARGGDRPNGFDAATTAAGCRSTGPDLVGLYKDRWDGLSLSKSLVPELAPRSPESMLKEHAEKIVVSTLGCAERTLWGYRRTLRGVAAIRGFCISATPIVELRASLSGLRFHSEQPQAFPLKYEKINHNKKKYVFNIWYDFSQFAEGLYDLELQCVHDNGRRGRWYRHKIVIAPPPTAEQFPNSDRLVCVAPGDERPLDERVNSQPSVIRPAGRARFPTPPRNVLVVRVDQLGDIVISLPAIRRLRQLLPAARLVGLLSFANVDLAKTLDLFDEVVAVDVPEDEWEQRRVMPLDRQFELRQLLAPFNFDVAIDLSISDMSRPVLPLSGAPFLIGFRDENSPWLSAYIEGVTRDPRNGAQEIAYSTQVLGLVEWFGAMLGDGNRSQVVRRDDLSPDRIVGYGVSPGERFAVLHTGARLRFSRWPHYASLASMLLGQTDLKIVMMTDDPQLRAGLPPDLLASDRFHFVDRRLPFDDFDALLSFCTVFVGNDSGPAHLASLRGANVVNLFLARHNWNEWGHENRGYIISRRVPCAGCQIYHSPEECGKEFACITNISPQEVFATIARLI